MATDDLRDCGVARQRPNAPDIETLEHEQEHEEEEPEVGELAVFLTFQFLLADLGEATRRR